MTEIEVFFHKCVSRVRSYKIITITPVIYNVYVRQTVYIFATRRVCKFLVEFATLRLILLVKSFRTRCSRGNVCSVTAGILCYSLSQSQKLNYLQIEDLKRVKGKTKRSFLISFTNQYWTKEHTGWVLVVLKKIKEFFIIFFFFLPSSYFLSCLSFLLLSSLLPSFSSLLYFLPLTKEYVWTP